MSNLEDLLGRKKTVAPVLDLSKNVIQTKEEFKRLMEKVPDYKMRPVKFKTEEIKIKEKDYRFKMSKKEQKNLSKHNGKREPIYTYADPVPTEMKDITLIELCTVPIDWKMLTTTRPKSKQEEEFFSRMVEMGKLQLKTDARDRRDFMLNSCIKKIKNKSGILETRLQSCQDCGEEMCCGNICRDFNYDLFTRVEPKISKSKLSVSVLGKKNSNDRKKIKSNGKKVKSS